MYNYLKKWTKQKFKNLKKKKGRLAGDEEILVAFEFRKTFSVLFLGCGSTTYEVSCGLLWECRQTTLIY